MKPTISIVMPFKDEAAYLAAALQSVADQDYPHFELIAVDDHSKDASPQMVQRWAQRDSRFQLLSNPGKGVIKALQAGFQLAKGDFVTRFDGDDLMPVDKLSSLLELLLAAGPGSLATGAVKYFSEGEVGRGMERYGRWLNQVAEQGLHRQKLFKECVIASPNWMLWREDFLRFADFDRAYYPEDYYFVLQMLLKGIKVISTAKVTHFWRDHPTRASRTLEQYRDQTFFDIKLDFFSKLYPQKKVRLWGAGPRGKALAKKLQERNFQIHWVANNPKKISKVIYGHLIHPVSTLATACADPCLIAISQRGALASIEEFLHSHKITPAYEF